MKTFEGDFNIFLNKIKNDDPFSITRFGDGELSIIEGKYLNLLNKGNGEFAYDPNDKKYDISRELLTESFTYLEKNYFWTFENSDFGVLPHDIGKAFLRL